MKATGTLIVLLLLAASLSAQLNTWTGTVSRDWQTAGNWSLGHSPLSTENAFIPSGTTYSPLVGTVGGCQDLTVQTGAILEIEGILSVQGTFYIYGTITYSDTLAFIGVTLATHWENGSSINKNFNCQGTDTPVFYTEGDLIFESGSSVVFDSITVFLMGASNTTFENHSPSTSFYSLIIRKDNASVTYDPTSSQDMIIGNGLYLDNIIGSSTFIVSSDHDILIGNENNSGVLNNSGGHLKLLDGELLIYAHSYNVSFSDADTVNHLTLHSDQNPSLLVPGDFHVLGDLVVYGYPIYFNGHVTLEGHLSNELNLAATLRMIKTTMKGSLIQTVYRGFDCDTLTVNKTAGDVRLLNGVIGCDQYDWVAGGINVLGGVFTADNLVDNGIFGKFWLSPGGIINLTNPDGYVDLNAEIHIYGGSFKINGGIDNSYWGFAANCILDMDGGVLDFTDRGIRLDDNFSVDDDISGGLIRTTMGFHGASRTDFNPPAGTFEFYGTGDYTINQGSSNTFHHLKVNKGTSDGPEEYQPLLKNSPRSPDDDPPGGGSRSNTLTLASDLNLTGDMVISSGILDVSISDYDIYLQGNWTNYVGDAGFIERNGEVEFYGATNSTILTPETFERLTENKTSTSFTALQLGPGDGDGVDVSVLSTLYLQDGELELNSPCTLSVGGYLIIGPGAELNANDAGTIYIQAGHFWENQNTPGTNFYAGSSSIVEFNSDHPTLPQYIMETSPFNDIIINSNAMMVLPTPAAGFGFVQCNDMDILNGSLGPGGGKVVVNNTLNIYGDLDLSDIDDTLIVHDIIWKAGSNSTVLFGRIMVGDDWTFEDGTNAVLGAGNTVEFYQDGSSLIECYDASARFGTVELNKSPGTSANTYLNGTSTHPMHLNGDLIVRSGNQFYLDFSDLVIDGTLYHEAGSMIALDGTSSMEVSGPYDINGTLDVGSGGVLTHDFFDLETTGMLIVEGGSLITDTPTAAPYWCNFKGTLTMTDGIIEATYNNQRFTSTFSGSISGGAFRVGGAFEAADYVFQPSGGTVEFINGAGHIFQPGTGNWFHHLQFNNNGSRQLMNPLTVMNDVLISTGGFDCNNYDIYVGGDWTNNAGTSAFVEANGTVYFNGSDPVNAQHIYGETFFDLTNINYDSELQIAGATTVTHNFNTGGVGAKTRVTGPSFVVENLLDLSDATLILATSGPVVDVEDFIQGGILEVNGGTFTANDLVDSYIKGTYNISGGIVDLSQNTGAGAFVDLKADITMLGGELYVRGGALAYSRWTGVPAPQLTMAPGSVLDFTTAGIYVQDNNFIEDISGGLVRCRGMININATNFTPAGGTFEIYGNATNYVSHLAGSYFHNLKSNLGAAYTLYPLSDLEIKGELKVSSGRFHTNGYEVNLGD